MLPALLLGGEGLASLRAESWTGHVRDLEIGTSWIREHAPQDALVVAEYHDVLYPYLRRASTWVPSDLATLRAFSTHRPTTYLLIGPKLEWSNTGEIRYSEQGQTLLRAMEDGSLAGELVFEDRKALVHVFLLQQAGEHSNTTAGPPAERAQGDDTGDLLRP
jgi:hypothetical protein